MRRRLVISGVASLLAAPAVHAQGQRQGQGGGPSSGGMKQDYTAPFTRLDE